MLWRVFGANFTGVLLAISLGALPRTSAVTSSRPSRVLKVDGADFLDGVELPAQSEQSLLDDADGEVAVGGEQPTGGEPPSSRG